MTITCTCCPGCCEVGQGKDLLTLADIQEEAPEWSLANIITRRDGTVATGQLLCWCPCCKHSQNTNG